MKIFLGVSYYEFPYRVIAMRAKPEEAILRLLRSLWSLAMTLLGGGMAFYQNSLGIEKIK